MESLLGSSYSLDNEMLKLILRNVSKGLTEFSVSDSDVSQLEEIKAAASAANKKQRGKSFSSSSDDSSTSDSSSEDSSESLNDNSSGRRILEKKKVEMCTLPINFVTSEELPRNPLITQ